MKKMKPNATLLSQADECCELAKTAFAAGDQVTGIAATQLAAQIVQLARIQSKFGLPAITEVPRK